MRDWIAPHQLWSVPMTTAILPEDCHPTIEITEPSNGHVLPLAVAVVLFLLSAVVSVWIAGPPLH